MNWYKIAQRQSICSWLDSHNVNFNSLRKELALPKGFQVKKDEDNRYSVVFIPGHFVIVNSEPSIIYAVLLTLSRLEYIRDICK